MTTQRFEMRRYGDHRLMPVDVEGPECPHCKFVSQYVKAGGPGDITYVCRGPYHTDIRRVVSLWTKGTLLLMCEERTVEAVEAELRALRGSA